MKKRLSYIFAIAGLLLSCAAEALPEERVDITLTGKINASSVEETINEIRKHPTGSVNLVVKSAGGDAPQAMTLGDAMLENDVTMSIENYCHSACSSYLIPSAAAVSIKSNATVAFHGTPSFVHIPEHAPPEIKDYFTEFRQREEAFMTRRGVDYSAWLWVQSKIQQFCWFENPDFAVDDINRYGRANRVHLVAPSKLTLQQLGIENISGVFPTSAKQAWEFATQNGFRKAIAVAFVPTLDMPEEWTFTPPSECNEETRKEAGY